MVYLRKIFSRSMPVHVRNMVVGGRGSLTKMIQDAPCWESPRAEELGYLAA
jgi:hypothetical protein